MKILVINAGSSSLKYQLIDMDNEQTVSYTHLVNAFTAPNNIAAGGITGVATMLNYLWGTPCLLYTSRHRPGRREKSRGAGRGPGNRS